MSALVVVAAVVILAWLRPRRARDIPTADLHEAFHRHGGTDA